jgi:hypothetical protein
MSADSAKASDLEQTETENLTDDEYEELTSAEPEAGPVSYSGTDFDVEGLVRRLSRGDVVIPSFGHGDPTLEVAGFQRGFVWRRPQMDRFIESLLLGFPIPGIILVQQVDKRYLVLDGQQRLRTLKAFYDGVHNKKEFALDNVAKEFKGLTYKALTPELKRQLDNTFIQATIVRTDGSRSSLEAIYQVFERLNSGGTQLTPHEIRIALYPGAFVELIAQINDLSEWRDLYGVKSPRLRDQELILRILALYIDAEHYFPPLKKFLNDFLGKHRELARFPTDKIVPLFEHAASLLLEAEGRQALRYQSSQVNAALTEALFVGLMRRLAKNSRKVNPARVREAVSSLTNNADMTAAISRATANEEAVRTRLNLATKAFSSI